MEEGVQHNCGGGGGVRGGEGWVEGLRGMGNITVEGRRRYGLGGMGVEVKGDGQHNCGGEEALRVGSDRCRG